MNNSGDDKYCDILLTDIQLHVQKPRKPKSVRRIIEKTLRNDKDSFRVYSNQYKADEKNKTLWIKFDQLTPEIQIKVKAAEREGKIVRFLVPKDGIPVYNGPDAVEKFKADTKKKKYKRHLTSAPHLRTS